MSRKPTRHPRLTEAEARLVKVPMGSVCPYSGQYTMIFKHFLRKQGRIQATCVRGKRMPSGGPGSAGHHWRLTDATIRRRR